MDCGGQRRISLVEALKVPFSRPDPLAAIAAGGRQEVSENRALKRLHAIPTQRFDGNIGVIRLL
jgi:hypothetical protein